jgi:NAD-dependent deacetylase
MRRRVAAAAKPNPAHIALANVEQQLGERIFLCTQNVDDLHEQAGSIRVVHMHGELFKSRCDRCTRTPFHDTTTYDPPIEIPRCDCGGRIRPHICWFGEMPFELDRIFRALDECTVFHSRGHVGGGRTSRELCGAREWSCPNDLCGRGGACKRFSIRRMPLGESRGRFCLTYSA